VSTTLPLLTIAIRREQDLLLVRQRSRDIGHFLGFSDGDTTRITTALSEIGRNAFEYAGGGRVSFAVEQQNDGPDELVISVADSGPGIADLPAILSPEFRSLTGMGVGIKGSRALMDRLAVDSQVGHGTQVTMAKALPKTGKRFAAPDVGRLTTLLTRATEATPLGELQIQNQALIAALEELTRRQQEIERLSGIADDARARAEEAQLVAERSLVVRDRFMALTTHELRTPLNAILGYMELLDDDLGALMSEKQKDYFVRVRRAAKHLLGITNDFLDMAQGDAGRLTVARTEGTARQVVTEASALITPQAAVRNVSVDFVEANEGITYQGDAARVRQILVNVLGNAVSFTPPGGRVRVTATHEAEAPASLGIAGGSWCVFRVEDTGPGIPEDKLAHVFEPFVQLSANGQTTRKGSGLGLTVSRQLALLMGGELTAESTGAGATFSLWLPA
jgi:signal transduction histidine kinase